MPDGSATAHLYRPKLATVLAEGYNFSSFCRDMIAALTVAIVAVPLSMAIAVASGVSPERGLYAAVIGGFLVSALGGSRYQIGGPAGAFEKRRADLEAGVELLIAHETVTAEQFAPLRSSGAGIG
jgi:SulP family sulfate permease